MTDNIAATERLSECETEIKKLFGHDINLAYDIKHQNNSKIGICNTVLCELYVYRGRNSDSAGQLIHNGSSSLFCITVEQAKFEAAAHFLMVHQKNLQYYCRRWNDIEQM